MRLQEARKAQNLTQEQLAARLRPRISRGYLARLERGYHTPSLRMLARLAKSLRCTVSDLLGDQPFPSLKRRRSR